jgi:hypothetical protein
MASEAFSEVHLAQRLVSGVAHWLQNREAATLSVPHFEQRIGLPTDPNDDSLLYHARASKGIASQAGWNQATQLMLVGPRLLST